MFQNQNPGGIMTLAGKKALITGGNSGIGFATARDGINAARAINPAIQIRGSSTTTQTL